MKTLCYIVVFVILSTEFLLANDAGILVRPASDAVVEVWPGEVHTSIFRVINEQNERQDFQADVQLPINWKLVTQEFPFELDKGQQENKLVSFYVPSTTPAGEYTITFRIASRKYPSISDQFDLYVHVKPVQKVSIKLIEAPQSVLAGESLKAKFNVCNESNIPEKILLETEKCELISPTKRAHVLPADSCITVQVVSKTSSYIQKPHGESFSLTAKIANNDSVSVRKRHHYNIIPKQSKKTSTYYEIPLHASLSYMYAKRNDNAYGGLQGYITGDGFLDKKNKHNISFELRGPDRYNVSYLGERDKYTVKYSSANAQITIGDNAFHLTQLTENHRYGRGVNANYETKTVKVGGYYQTPRWYHRIDREYAAYARYSLNKRYQFGVNALKKQFNESNANVYSLTGELNPVNNTHINFEISEGKKQEQSGRAYLLNLSSHYKNVLGRIHFISADKNFPGYYSDTKYMNGYLSFRLNRSFDVNASFRKDAQNIARDTTLYAAPYSENIQAGFRYRVNKKTHLRFHYRQKYRKDRLPAMRFKYEEQTARFGLSHHRDKIQLSLNGEIGMTTNLLSELSGTKSNILSLNATAYFRPNDRQQYRGYVYYQKSKRYNTDKYENVLLGLRARWELFYKTHITLKVQNNFNIEEYYRDRNLFELEGRHTFRNRHQLFLRARYTLMRNTLDRRDRAIVAGYDVPFGIPVYKKDDVAPVHGMLINRGAETVSNVVVRLDGNTAVTDSEGHFEFPAVKSGKHFLSIDNTTVNLHEVPTEPLPLELNVKPGKDNHIELGLTTAADLTGRFVVKSKGHKSSLLSVDMKCPNMIVELRRGNETVRRLTDKKGTFEFKDIRPGTWEMKIYDDCIPESHYLKKNQLTVHLEMGEQKEITLNILQKERKIKFQQWNDVSN